MKATIPPFAINPSAIERVTNLLKRQVDHHHTPSVQYTFFDVDRILCEFRYGLSNVREKQPVEPATTYHLFSVTKTLTALAVLQLAEAGRLRVEQPIAEYLPGVPFHNRITIEHLLSHSSGIPNPLPLRWIHLADEHAHFNHDRFFEGIFRGIRPSAVEPGSRFQYSNLGYVLLGQLIEKVSGKTFETYITGNILERCGIHADEMGFDINPVFHATGYHRWWSLSYFVLRFLIDTTTFMAEREGKWKPFRAFYNNGKAYGGLTGSINGLIKYAQALMREPSPLLSEPYKKLLFAERIIAGKRTGMAFAWFTGTLNANRYVAHAGGGGGYYVELRIYPDLQAGSAIMYNRSGMFDTRMLNHTDAFFLPDRG